MDKIAPRRPDIFDYLDYREFLRDFYAYRKTAESGFSLRSLRVPRPGDEGDGRYSAQFLSMVIKGSRPIPEAMVEPLGRALGLNDDERRFFERLVRYTLATDIDKKREAFSRLAWRSEFRQRHGIGSRDRLAFITRGYVGDIYLMTSLDTFQATAEWLSERLLYPLSQSQIDEALDILCDLELIRIEADGRVIREEAPRPEPNAGEEILFQLYHEEQCNKARLALSVLPTEERRFATWGISGLTRETAPLFFAELESVLARELERLTQKYDCAGGDTVAQINLQCFPVNRPESTKGGP